MVATAGSSSPSVASEIRSACSSSARALQVAPVAVEHGEVVQRVGDLGVAGPERRLPVLGGRLEQLEGGVLLPGGELRRPEVVLGEGDGELVAGRGRPPLGQDLLEDLRRLGVPARRGRGERAGPRRRLGGDRLRPRAARNGGERAEQRRRAQEAPANRASR